VSKKTIWLESAMAGDLSVVPKHNLSLCLRCDVFAFLMPL
jgi:hypothetical protein